MAKITIYSMGRSFIDSGPILGYGVRVGIGLRETEVSNTLVFHV